MALEREKEELIHYCKKMIDDGLTKGTGGNISIIDRKNNLIAISTSGQDYHKMKVSDIPVMDLEGNKVEGDGKPSSELQMHMIIYKNFPSANAIVHCHSVYATSLSILRQDLPASNYLVASAGGNDVKCAKYASYGTREIGLAAVEALKNRWACLLANHGQIAYSQTLEKAFNIASTVEECCQTYMIAKSVGDPVILNTAEMDFMVEKFQSYGR